MDSPSAKKVKSSSSFITLGPLDSISHRGLIEAEKGYEHLEIVIESGSANSVFKFQTVDLDNKNEKSIRIVTD